MFFKKYKFFIDDVAKFDIIELGGVKMKILPNADKAVIPIEKFVNYALDLGVD